MWHSPCHKQAILEAIYELVDGSGDLNIIDEDKQEQEHDIFTFSQTTDLGAGKVVHRVLS